MTVQDQQVDALVVGGGIAGTHVWIELFSSHAGRYELVDRLR